MRALVRTNRDIRVDFFRGFALYCIFVGHIPDHALWVLTLQVLGPSDSTESFIFLAGYSAAFAYGRAYERQGWPYAASAVVLRVWSLYVVHIFMFTVFVAQVSWSAARFANPAYIDEINIGAFLDEPHIAVLDALSLRFQPAFMDILPLYIVILLIFALMLPLIRRPLVLLAVSGGLYALVRLTRFNFTTAQGEWFFNPLAWQFLFIGGAAVAVMPDRVKAVLQRAGPVLLPVAIVFVLMGLFISAVWRVPAVYGALPEPVAAMIYTTIDKSGLHPARLLHFLSLAYLAARLVPPGARWLTSWAALPFTLAGQHGLVVFALGVFLSFLGRLVMQEWDATLATQLVIAIVGWAVCVAVSAFQAWYDGKERGAAGGKPKPAASSPLAQPASPDSGAA
jgi:hypothetical protein